MAKENFNNHPLLLNTNKKIRETPGLHRPIVVFRGYVIECSIFIDHFINQIIITYLFSCKNSEAERILKKKKGKEMLERLLEIKTQYKGKEPFEPRKLFYQEIYVHEKSSNKLKHLKSIFNKIGVNSKNLSGYESLFKKLKEFYDVRNMVAHYNWHLISTKGESPEIVYQKLGGEIKEKVDKSYIDNFDNNYKRLNNNLMVIWYTFFEKYREEIIK